MDNQYNTQETIQQETPSVLQSEQPLVNQTQKQGKSKDTLAFVTVVLLVIGYPAGVLLMWLGTRWPKWAKIVISLPLILAILGIFAVALIATTDPLKRLNQIKFTNLCISIEKENPLSAQVNKINAKFYNI